MWLSCKIPTIILFDFIILVLSFLSFLSFLFLFTMPPFVFPFLSIFLPLSSSRFSRINRAGWLLIILFKRYGYVNTQIMMKYAYRQKNSLHKNLTTTVFSFVLTFPWYWMQLLDDTSYAYASQLWNILSIFSNLDIWS